MQAVRSSDLDHRLVAAYACYQSSFMINGIAALSLSGPGPDPDLVVVVCNTKGPYHLVCMPVRST